MLDEEHDALAGDAHLPAEQTRPDAHWGVVEHAPPSAVPFVFVDVVLRKNRKYRSTARPTRTRSTTTIITTSQTVRRLLALCAAASASRCC